MNEVASADAMEERLQIMSHLRERQAEIRALNATDAEIVCPKDADSSGSVEDVEAYIKANPWFALKKRLGHIHETTEEWRFVGCELCFAKTGRREPDPAWTSAINGRPASPRSASFGGSRAWQFRDFLAEEGTLVCVGMDGLSATR
jgi:hypothetical protein